MIVADTSAWVALFRGRGDPVAAELKSRLQQRERTLITDVILAEVLQGARSEEHAAELAAHLERFSVLRLRNLDDFRRAAALYRTARRAGITLRGTVDCLIASVCIRDGLPLLHADADFDRLASVSPLRTVTVRSGT